MGALTAIGERFRRVDPRAVDLGIVCLVLAVFIAPLYLSDCGCPSMPWWGYALAAANAIPLYWRRRAPFTVVLTVAGVVTIYEHLDSVLPDQPIQYGVLVAIYTVADLGKEWQRRFALIASPLGVLAATGSLHATLLDRHFPVLTVLAAYFMGTAARTRRRYAAALEQRALQVEREHETRLERAAARERARIAADMHDILGHAVSLMVVQAEAGRAVVRTDPDRAETALNAIGDAGREAMVQLRRLLGLLKTETGDRDPRPTAGSVAALVAQVRAAGLDVELDMAGEPRPLPADAEVAAYRIVQEALTNTVKHAASAAATVRLTWTDVHLEIKVADQGGGGDPTGTAGYGLVGIRERARACGGTAQAGPGPDGVGFVVTALLPLTAVAGSGTMTT